MIRIAASMTLILALGVFTASAQVSQNAKQTEKIEHNPEMSLRIDFNNLGNNDDQITVYPNPASDELIINSVGTNGGNGGSGTGEATGSNITIFTIKGVMVDKFKVIHPPVTLGLQDYAEGTYFLTFETDRGEVFTKKFVVTR
jgi:hypothetical protein